MGAQPGDMLEDGSFSLINHLEENLTSKEAVERIANHFASVSQEYPPLNVQNLPQDIQRKLNEGLDEMTVPILDELKVYNQIKKAKKPKSGVPGDLPRSLINEFSPELATPLTVIYQNIIRTGKWPSEWKIEHGIPLKKVANPQNEDELRIISLTAFYSKVLEKFVMEWLLEFIGPHIDWGQYGGQKGNSVTHYLIDFIDFIMYNQDLKNMNAVLAVAIDFSKAFNRQNHNILVCLLSDMGVPTWLLRIVIGFLENRQLLVNYKNEVSGMKSLPGGGPQGTILGMFLFLILINAAGFRDNLKNVGRIITKPFNKRIPMPRIHLKYVDDMTVAEALNLKKKLIPNPNNNLPRPVQYHQRTGHILPEGQSAVQSLLTDIKIYTHSNEMKLNTAKTKVILFNRSRNYDFLPECYFEEGENLEVVEEIKLLGVTIRSDLSWSSHCQQMCQKGYSRLWMLRRLKPLGANTAELLEVYQTQIRSVLEFAAPAWSPGLNLKQMTLIERVQKSAYAIILGLEYRSYANAMKVLEQDSLTQRRESLCLNFAQKALRHEKYKNWFCTNDQYDATRSNKVKLKPVENFKSRFMKSPLYYLTNLLNEN